MNYELLESARKELSKMQKNLVLLFIEHISKITEDQIKSRKHLSYSIPYFVEKVTKQGRIVYSIDDNTIYVLHCFDNHKDYEKWYKSY
jgi:Txe/YoeB family toxin of Txe-Axe toxin-antitoxin module